MPPDVVSNFFDEDILRQWDFPIVLRQGKGTQQKHEEDAGSYTEGHNVFHSPSIGL
jgi:hypothetical protein